MPDLSGYRFSSTHEWVHRDGERTRVGISDHAQSQLGDVIFIELPEVGAVLHRGDRFGTVESVKAASDLYAPVTGRVTVVNTALSESPERINSDPYGEGWMVELDDVDDGGAELVDADTYSTTMGA